MKNKYILINLTVLLGFLLFVPVIFAQAETYLTYVGLQVDQLYDSHRLDQTDVCLDPIFSEMTIEYDGSEIDTAFISDSVGPIINGCSNNIFWSNLVELTSDYNYDLLLSTLFPDTNGYEASDGVFWYMSEVNMANCNTVCESLGLTCVLDVTQSNDNSECTACRHFYPAAGCSNYRNIADNPSYSYNNDQYSNQCQTRGSGIEVTCVGDTYWNPTYRLCECWIPTNFSFNFTAPVP